MLLRSIKYPNCFIVKTGCSKSYNKYILYYCIHGLGNMGKYLVLGFCIVPPFGQANTASLELNISPYCPPSQAIILYVRGPTYEAINVFTKWTRPLWPRQSHKLAG